MSQTPTPKISPRPKRAVDPNRTSPRINDAPLGQSLHDRVTRIESHHHEMDSGMHEMSKQLVECREMLEQSLRRIEALEQSSGVTAVSGDTRDLGIDGDGTPDGSGFLLISDDTSGSPVAGDCTLDGNPTPEVNCDDDGDVTTEARPSVAGHRLVAFESHELGESVWMAPFIMFGTAMDCWSKVTIAAGFVLNICVQWCFCAVAFASFGEVDLPDVGAISRWRYGVGHAADWADPLTSASLVSRVCGGDDSLASSTEQDHVVWKIAEYSKDLDLLVTTVQLTQGTVLSMVASVLWSLVVCSDLMECVSLLLASFSVFFTGKKDGYVGTVVSCCTDELWQVVALSPLHVSVVCCIVALRMSVAFVLMYVGITWILSTTSTENIILNCAALSFVMEVDELLFGIMLTSRVQRAVKTLQPFSQKLISMEGHIRPLIVYIAVIIVIGFATPNLLETRAHMEDLRHVLCDGNLDFVFAEMPSFGWIALHQVDTFSEIKDVTYSYYALEEAVWASELDNLSFTWLSRDPLFFEFVQTASVRAMSDFTGVCSDENFQWRDVATHFVWTLGIDSPTCNDPQVFDTCSSSGYPFVRFACPVTCGCRDPRSSLWLNGFDFGCPSKCTSTEEYLVSLHAISCTSPAVGELQESDAWKLLVENYEMVGAEFNVDRSEGATALLEQGCGYITNREAEFCIETGEHQSLARWCPVECGCRAPSPEQAGSFVSQCPSQCAAWRTRFETQLTQLPCADSEAPQDTGLVFKPRFPPPGDHSSWGLPSGAASL